MNLHSRVIVELGGERYAGTLRQVDTLTAVVYLDAYHGMSDQEREVVVPLRAVTVTSC